MASLINIGLSGASNAQSGMHTTGNNITNVDTAGYSRQQNIQSAKGSIREGHVFIGTGTTLADVRRVYNNFLENQLRTTTSLSSDSSAYMSQIGPIDKLLSDKDTGITGALKSFFSSLQNAAAKPTEDASRQLLLTSAQALSKRFNTIASQLNQQNSNLNGNLSSMATQVNNLTSAIAQYNDQISRVSVVQGSPNDLLDKRNEAVRQLSELVGVDVTEREGNLDVYLKNGQSLVLGTSTNTLSTVASPTDPTRMNLQLNRGTTQIDITASVTGGEIGGLLRYRTDVLDPSLNELGRVALVVADQINSQLSQGIDKNGNFGASMFNDINSAALISQRSIAKAGNSAGSGNLDVTIKNTGKLSTSDYQVTFTSATGYSVKKLPEGTDMGTFDLNDNPPKVIDGFSLNLNGGPVQAGDSFKITPTRGAASSIDTVLTDPKRIALAAPLNATSGAGNQGTGIIGQPNLTSKLDIYDSAQRLALENGLKYSTPVKLVFGDEKTVPQTYTVHNAKGDPIASGTIIPGQENKLQINVPIVDANGNAVTPAATYSFDMTVAGAPKAGDNYTVALTGAGSADNRNAQAVIDLQTKQTIDLGDNGRGVSFTDAYGKLVENIGGKTAQAKLDGDATGALQKSASEASNSVSGVDLDEETGNLIKYQQYYTASSQIIKIAQETFSTLINSL
ncbi:flagellar hook-associated protein FlgK [Pseudomonas fluorescens]|uniref:Flagellar hook-associated protein 1 n=1 Tax=Pseudomonas fluorescens TaxID=294 RepID=A0A5E6TB76_PSEFL|nr:flagellar hook-associated protein FlgK [Pseudomonas fluorescens]VVM90531.1 hypothetical protein PS652_02759 [Pseudomonas fluorescens]